MNIALDWDNTFTRDSKLWETFIYEARLKGYRIYIVTSRGMDTPIEYVPSGVNNVVYCNYRAKKKVTEEQGIEIDIWIDDDPFYITEGFIE